MHWPMLEPPARRRGPLDDRDARSKLIPLIVFLVVISTTTRAFPESAAAQGLLLVAACVWARVPVTATLRRAAVVLPFILTFTIICWIAGDAARGVALAVKSYLSCLAVSLIVATTPLPVLLRGLESLGVPRFLLMVSQFVYRYLFVISEEARQMSRAAVARGGSAVGGLGRLRFQAAAGALAVLFARSYRRAGDIHQAMLARGISGRMHSLDTPRFQFADTAFLIMASMVPVSLRIVVERLG